MVKTYLVGMNLKKQLNYKHMTPFKKTILSAVLLMILVTLVRIVALFISQTPNYKYTIYAADKVYHCNQFDVSGNTIYFKDVNKKNVCINGNYTLIYETEDKIK